MISIRTDLALEAKELYSEKTTSRLEGVNVNEFEEEQIKITEVKITNEAGEKAMNKPKGTYITMEIPPFVQYDGEAMENVAQVLAKQLEPLVKVEKNQTVLVVGLGNWNIVSDAVGPKVVEKLMITRHLMQLVPDEIDENIRPVCGISPGVLGLTGMETGEILKGIVERIKPSLVVAVDALASRKMHRVNRTIQITNTGISPGGGIGNNRMKINEEALGVPVVAIGVPTVVHAATIAYDTINLVLNQIQQYSKAEENFYSFLGNIGHAEKEKMIRDILNPYVGNLMVTPKDVDMTIESMAKIIANGLNISLQPALTLDDINTYLS
ncbi:GPR endopeptidase [Oceanirhabdus sp. W0125-5]|uniref:GPR endopeptidase n=1 Tax=Oceanirhabdus sp. W0125-5 TaxID=2999116 RepID=UPI0022F2BFD3|nr:GPR endopeptidase [Oceanirhabdus sp. W0125-5]WBW99788.1 GPR endopeptidase [Oceanirhabdus sp. W0125-5]